jgi:hypothetical protein
MSRTKQWNRRLTADEKEYVDDAFESMGLSGADGLIALLDLAMSGDGSHEDRLRKLEETELAAAEHERSRLVPIAAAADEIGLLEGILRSELEQLAAWELPLVCPKLHMAGDETLVDPDEVRAAMRLKWRIDWCSDTAVVRGRNLSIEALLKAVTNAYGALMAASAYARSRGDCLTAALFEACAQDTLAGPATLTKDLK